MEDILIGKFTLWNITNSNYLNMHVDPSNLILIIFFINK